MDFKDKKIFITGGSAGIGKSFLKKFIEKGALHFAIMGRREGPLEELENEFPDATFLLVQGDVSKKEDLEKAVNLINNEWGTLDILVNNAGVVSAGALEDISDDDIIDQININVTGLVLLTKKALPLLKKSKDGAIINVSSGLGYIAWPFYSIYAVTKAGVRQFSDALRRELFEFPLHIMTVYPTATETPMMDNAKVDNMDDPDMVAERSIEGLLNNELNVVFGGDQRLKDIETNFNEPRKIDEKAKERYESLRERTENHRAM